MFIRKRYISLFAILSLGIAGCSQINDLQEDQKADEDSSTEVVDDNKVLENESSEDLFEKVRNNEPTQSRIDALTDIAMYYYWYGGDKKVAEEELFKGITLHGDYGVVEESFHQAVILDPLNTDLRRSLASAQILQNDLEGALLTLEEIINVDPKNYETNLLHAVYSKVIGNEDEFDAGIENLYEIDENETDRYLNLLNTVDEIKETKLNTEVPDDLPEKDHAFITLGYALSDEGEMEDTLIERLKVTLEAAEAYPNSKLIVTGGVPKNNNTEAKLMAEWLIDQGIDEERIIEDNLATDTVENALFTMDEVQNEDLKDVTIISSATHMRRALAVFTEANNKLLEISDKDIEREFTNLVYMDFDSEEEAKEVTVEEDMLIHQDLMRTSGIWRFPGIQR